MHSNLDYCNNWGFPLGLMKYVCMYSRLVFNYYSLSTLSVWSSGPCITNILVCQIIKWGFSIFDYLLANANRFIWCHTKYQKKKEKLNAFTLHYPTWKQRYRTLLLYFWSPSGTMQTASNGLSLNLHEWLHISVSHWETAIKAWASRSNRGIPVSILQGQGFPL